MDRINQQDINNFLAVLAPIQARLARKYGQHKLMAAQQDRHKRIQAKKDAIFTDIDEAMHEQG